MEIDDNTLAIRWIEEAKSSNHNELHKTASSILYDLAAKDPEHAIKVMDIIAENTDDQFVLANLGAGPLEDILNSPSGDSYVDSIILRARKFKNWRYVLGNVWPRQEESQETYKKVNESINKFFPNGRL